MKDIPATGELAAIVAAYLAMQRAQTPALPPAPASRWREAARALPEFPPHRRA